MTYLEPVRKTVTFIDEPRPSMKDSSIPDNYLSSPIPSITTELSHTPTAASPVEIVKPTLQPNAELYSRSRPKKPIYDDTGRCI